MQKKLGAFAVIFPNKPKPFNFPSSDYPAQDKLKLFVPPDIIVQNFLLCPHSSKSFIHIHRLTQMPQYIKHH